MSIYKEIESTDKVFGRTRKISEGLFSGGFELVEMYVDEVELTSSISGWVEDIDGTTTTHHTVDILPNGKVSSVDIDKIDAEETLEFNKNNWTNVIAGDYYANVYDRDPTSDKTNTSESQFMVSYGNAEGYGSLNDAKSTSVTRAIYNQYRNILLGPGDSRFTFGHRTNSQGIDRDSIYIINFTSKRLKEKFDAGNLEFQLKLTDGDLSHPVVFRDDSRFTSSASTSTNSSSGRVFEIVKGSLIDEENEGDRYATGEGVGVDESFGLAYPDLGIIILNPYALACEFGSAIETQQTADDALAHDNIGRQLSWYGDVDQSIGADSLRWGNERNHQNFLKLFSALKDGASFKSRSTELVPSKHYFIRVKNTDFNYSNNPTYVYRSSEASGLGETYSGTGLDRGYWLGRVRHEDFADDPKTYITTIGLYNENNDLVAVAKLSVPILKSFDTEALIKVKLDF